MKTPYLPLLLAVAGARAASGQGSLTPPAGPPAAVYKTLDQVEARTPLVAGQPGVAISANGGISINQSGSYYLTSNRTVATGNGITIFASGVTVDLNGFTLASTSAANVGSGIVCTNQKDIIITNGQIRGSVTNLTADGSYTGSGFLDGIDATGTENARVDRLNVAGCRADGIKLGFNIPFNSIVESCSVRMVGGRGIYAFTIQGSSAMNTGSIAVHGHSVANCIGHSNNASGIAGDIVSGSVAVGKTNGIAVNSSATNCYGECLASGAGISTPGTASYCSGKSSTGNAITAGIAVACTTAGGTISSPQKHLGTP